MSWLFALIWFGFGAACALGFALMLWRIRPEAQDSELPAPQPAARVGSYRPSAWCVACHAPYRIEAKCCPECGAEVNA